MKQTNSLELHKRAIEIIPGGAQTISKYYGRLPYGTAPAFILYANGCKIIDIDGNEFIDWSAALGPIILGYSQIFPDSFETSLPLPHKDEVRLAEKLIDLIPCAEMVRFFKDGSSATSAAVRLARAVTGRSGIVCCGYHGWHDWYAVSLPRNRRAGIPIDQYKHTSNVPYGNIEFLKTCFRGGSVACLIMEPMNRQCPEKASKKYLQQVRELCDKYNVILIFDEIIMGFRYAMAGGQEYFGVTPDLATYSKAVSNGYPLSALVGKKELMKELEYMQVSGTYFGEVQSIQAALQTIEFMERNNVINCVNMKAIELFNDIDLFLSSNKLNDMVWLKGKINGVYGPWSSFVWGEDYRDEELLFLQTIFENGIFYNCDHFMTYAHRYKDMEKTLKVYKNVFDYVLTCRKEGIVKDRIKCTINNELRPKI